MTRLQAMIAAQLGEVVEDAVVTVGIETDRGPWVQALIAAGSEVSAVNRLQAVRYRARHGVSGAKTDKADAHNLADMVRTDSHQLRPVAVDTARAEAIKVVARAHQTASDIDRGTHPAHPAAAARAAGVLPGRVGGVRGSWRRPTPWSCLSTAPDPASAARLSSSQICSTPAGVSGGTPA